MSNLFWINEKCDGDEVNRYLGNAHSLSFCGKGSTSEKATVDNTTLEDLEEYCDSEAEGANYHHFVGVHKKLGTLISKKSNSAVAKAVMFEIAIAGGLHEFND